MGGMMSEEKKLRKRKKWVDCFRHTLACFALLVFLGFAFGTNSHFSPVFSFGGVLAALVTVYLTLYP